MATAKRTAVRGKRASARRKSVRKTKLASASLRRAKQKGGPAPGTPSPMRTRLSAELQEHARRLFTQTDQPGTEIAADCGVDESVIRRMALREGWVRFVAPPRDLPPVAKLLAEVEKLEASLSPDRHPEVRGPLAEPRRIDAKLSHESAVALRGSLTLAPQGDGERASQDDGEGAVRDVEKDIAEFEHAVMGYVREFDALRKNGLLLPTQNLATARAINTDTFNKLQRMRATHIPGSTHDDVTAFSDIPADPDAFRDELARRIAAFMESRPDDAAAESDSASAPDASE